MARYSAFLGRRVEVQYRAGDILLPASGTFVADSGRSIFLEQHFQQKGQEKNFRWEIPYQYIVRIEEKPAPPVTPGDSSVSTERASVRQAVRKSSSSGEPQNAAAAVATGGAPSILPLPNRPKTA